MIWHPSPNFGPRRDGLKPHLIVLHYTAMTSAEAALRALCDPEREVSAHYLVGDSGTVWNLVDEEMRAWHAGAGEWHGQNDINSRSIGIELDNDGFSPFPEAQMMALERLVGEVMARHNVPPHGVIGHSDMAPGRKIDPGARFDWQRLARAGLAARRPRHEGPENLSLDSFRELARANGYTAPVEDEILLSAVRLRHRPGAIGVLCREDFAPFDPNG